MRDGGGSPVRGRLLALILTAVLLVALPGWAADAADTGRIAQEQVKLKQLRERISRLKGDLGAVRGKHDAQQAALEQTDTAIGRITVELRRLDGQEAAARKELARLQARQDACRAGTGTAAGLPQRPPGTHQAAAEPGRPGPGRTHAGLPGLFHACTQPAHGGVQHHT